MKNIFKSLIVLSLVICLGLLLVACGGNKDGGKGNGKGDGTEEHDCEKDGHVFADEPEYVYTEPTCYNYGRGRVRCTVCDEAVEEIEIEPLGHNPVVELEAIEPTCTKSGRTARIKCDRQGCWETLQDSESVPQKEHTPSFARFDAPSYVCKGYISIDCSECDRSMNGIIIPVFDPDDYTLVEEVGETKKYKGTVSGYDIEFEVSNFVVDYRYEDGDGHAILVGYVGDSTDIVIPATVKGYWGEEPLYTISADAFKGNTSITSVTFPDVYGENYVRVADSAFEGCTALEEVNNYNHFAYPRRVFANCTSLKSIHVASRVGTIGEEAFYNCASLENITFETDRPGSLQIDAYAFRSCTALKSLILPDDAYLAGSHILDGCTSIEEISIPEIGYSAYVKYLGELFADWCQGDRDNYNNLIPASLKKISVPTSVYLTNCSGIESITITVREGYSGEIADEWFSGCSSLREIILDERITGVGVNIFDGCTSLVFTEYEGGKYYGNILVGFTDAAKNGGVTEFTIKEGTVLVCPEFYKDLSLDKLTVPASLRSFNYMCGEWGGNRIGAFYYNGTLEDWCKVAIYARGGGSFNDNPMSFADAFYMIGESGEYETLGDTLVIPESVTEIGSAQFTGWKYTTLVLHGGVQYVSGELSPALDRVLYSGTIEEFANIRFSEDKSRPGYYTPNFYMLNAEGDWELLTVLVIPDTMTWIPSHAFEYLTSIHTVVIPDTVQDIGYYTFHGCTSLVNVFYEGDMDVWERLLDTGYYTFDNEPTVYLYSETAAGSVEDYLNGGQLYWHYDENGNPVAWIDVTSTVDGKTYNYVSTEVTVSDTYWQIIQYADSEGYLENIMDAEQLAMYRASANKDEFAAKIAAYASKAGQNLSLSFADGKMTMFQNGQSAVVGSYVELDGEIILKTPYGSSVFCYVDSDNGEIYEYDVNEREGVVYTTTKHVYTLANS